MFYHEKRFYVSQNETKITIKNHWIRKQKEKNIYKVTIDRICKINLRKVAGIAGKITYSFVKTMKSRTIVTTNCFFLFVLFSFLF